MCRYPLALSGIDLAVPQQEGVEPLPRAQFSGFHVFPSPGQVANRFLFRGWHPYRRQLSGARQASEHLGISTVSLDAIPSALWNQRGSDDLTVVTTGLNLVVDPVTTGASLVAEQQRLPVETFTQLINQLVDGTWLVGDFAAEIP